MKDKPISHRQRRPHPHHPGGGVAGGGKILSNGFVRILLAIGGFVALCNLPLFDSPGEVSEVPSSRSGGGTAASAGRVADKPRVSRLDEPPTLPVRRSEDATAAMLRQPSSWVDSEKKLKRKLKVLAERQKEGKDVGVKVLTRYLGEDVPAWVGEGVNEAEWEAEVAKRVAQMKEDEDRWRSDPRNNPMNRAWGAADDGEDDGGSHEVAKAEVHHHEREMAHLPAETLKRTFPEPSRLAGENAVPVLEPTFGTHRPEVDAVFAFADGYSLSQYLGFVESLLATGFTGDIVLAVSHKKALKWGVEEYLRSRSTVVVYEIEWECWDSSNDPVKSDTKEGMHMCSFAHGPYGVPDEETGGNSIRVTDDPRKARPIATARYELYWMWSKKYDGNRWIMLIDARDTWFQSDPFNGLVHADAEDLKKKGGELFFFQENSDVTSLRKSDHNRKWLRAAYNLDLESDPIFDKPVLCSGSTMGEQMALEPYLRAVVEQFDETQCFWKGCDQAFHNYLHYNHILEGAEGIGQIKLFDQGKGIINNLGAMRSKPLAQWGLLDAKTKAVLNWDKTLSPVAHQWDRDDELRDIVKDRRDQMYMGWKTNGKKEGKNWVAKFDNVKV